MNSKDILTLLSKPGVQSVEIPRDKVMLFVRYAVRYQYKESLDIDMITKYNQGIAIIKSEKYHK